MLVRRRCHGIIISGSLTLGDKKMGNIRIVTLMDNQNGERKDLAAEHGLSLYIETGYANILFDFGQGKHTYENAAALNIRPERVDYGVCSHGHYDHGGGYREFVKNGLSCPLATGKGFFSEKYSLGRTKAAFLGTVFNFRNCFKL